MKKILTILLCAAMTLSLVACGSKSEKEKTSKEEDTKITSEMNIVSDEPKNENQSSDDVSKDEKTPEFGNNEGGEAAADREPGSDKHYYSKIVVTSSVNVGAFIYGIDMSLDDFGVGGGSYMGYEPSFTISFDKSTGKAIGGVLKGYVSAYGGGEGETNYEELYEEAIACSPELSSKIYGFSRDVVERGDENYPIVTCISANVDVSEYWANFEQYLSLYFIERTQDVEGLIDSIMDCENNGLTVERGSNYIVDPINGLKYEWFD